MKIMSVTLASADIAAMAGSSFYWIDRRGKIVNSGTASPTVSGTYPNDPLDFSIYDHIKISMFSGVQTGAAGGVLRLYELWPSPTPPAGTGPATAQTISITVGATATLGTQDIADAIIGAGNAGVRSYLSVVGLFFSTVPAPATPISIEVWGQTRASQYG